MLTIQLKAYQSVISPTLSFILFYEKWNLFNLGATNSNLSYI